MFVLVAGNLQTEVLPRLQSSYLQGKMPAKRKNNKQATKTKTTTSLQEEIMILKLGVDISRLNRETRRTLNTIDALYRGFDEEPIITSTYEGEHSPSSLHYQNNAIDIRNPKTIDKEWLCGRLKQKLGHNFDVVLETDHIHIEYDPKN